MRYSIRGVTVGVSDYGALLLDGEPWAILTWRGKWYAYVGGEENPHWISARHAHRREAVDAFVSWLEDGQPDRLSDTGFSLHRWRGEGVQDRVEAARRLLAEHLHLFTISAYICDPKHCGHKESIILGAADRSAGYVRVCFSRKQLFEKVKSWSGTGDLRDHLLCRPRDDQEVAP